MTSRDEVEDWERRVRLREQDLLSDLDLTVEGTSRTDDDRHLSDLDYSLNSYLVGVQLEIPLDRVRERNALRRARTELAAARRDLAQLEDDVILEVRQAVRDFRSAANSVAIQRKIVATEEKNAKVAFLRFQNGELSNRDLTDAENNLVDARDRLVREQVNLEIARVEFLRDAGILILKENGTWDRPSPSDDASGPAGRGTVRGADRGVRPPRAAPRPWPRTSPPSRSGRAPCASPSRRPAP